MLEENHVRAESLYLSVCIIKTAYVRGADNCQIKPRGKFAKIHTLLSLINVGYGILGDEICQNVRTVGSEINVGLPIFE